jgi:hypothetical protein
MIQEINKDIVPIAILGQYEDNNILYPAAKILNENQNVAFDPLFVAASLISLYEAFLSHVSESKQVEFKHQFKFHLINMFQNKEKYITKFNDNSNQ